MITMYLEHSGVEKLRQKAYRRCFTIRECNNVDKIVAKIEDGSITDVSSFYDEVAKLTKRVKSDRSIKRWQILAEWFANELWPS